MVNFIAQTQVYRCERLSRSLNFHIDKNKSSKITVFAFLISTYLFEIYSDFSNLACNNTSKASIWDKIKLVYDLASGINLFLKSKFTRKTAKNTIE